MTILLEKKVACRLGLSHCPQSPLPAEPVTKTGIRRYDYAARTSRNVTFWLQEVTACQIRSREISVASRRVNVCSSVSSTEMCNKAYSTGQKGAWSNVWQFVLRLYGGHLQLRTLTWADSPLLDPHLQRYVHAKLMQGVSLQSVLRGTTQEPYIYISQNLHFSTLLLQPISTPNW
jgi:hypothetical protein